MLTSEGTKRAVRGLVAVIAAAAALALPGVASASSFWNPLPPPIAPTTVTTTTTTSTSTGTVSWSDVSWSDSTVVS